MRSSWQKTTGTLLRSGLALLLCGWFLWPAWQRSRPHAPFPLDDVYIHLDYARSFRLTAPLSWLPDQGFSSGETAPLYALLLAVGAALGLGPDALGLFATLVGIAGVLYGTHQLGALAPTRANALAVVAPLLVLGFGVVSWSLLSGMELGVYFALFARLLRSAWRRADGRSRAEPALLLATLVALRPEALLLALLFAAGIARDRTAARPLRRIGAALRLALPALLVQGSVFVANRTFTGETQSAGGILKLVTENPTLDDAARIREVLTNLVTAWFGAFSRSTVLPGTTLALLVGLAAMALRPRRHRGVTLALALAAPALAVLVSLNATARYQGFRYYVPALLCVLALALRGLMVLGRPRPKTSAFVALALLGLVAPKLPTFREHFARAAGNIAEQQVAVGVRLGNELPANARILVGDAGAIPYFSGRSAIDVLGLGGFRGLPFVRAATHGEAASLELLERLDPADRPTHLALYASWFPGLVREFGHEWFAVTLDDNVICGAPTKTVYHADWSALGEHVPEGLVPPGQPRRQLDELDFADLRSERHHRVSASRFLPTSVEVHLEDDARRFDGCRRLAPDQEVRFTLHTPDSAQLDTRATRIGVRGLNLQGTRFSLAPAADGGSFVAALELVTPPAPGAWQLGGLWFPPSRRDSSFEIAVLAGPDGALLCHLWWLNTD